MLDLNSRIEKNRAICDCSLGNELALMDIDTGKYYTLNPVGKSIWREVEKVVSIKGLVEILSKEFEVSEKNCLKDVLEYLNDLKDKGLIQAWDYEGKRD